MDLRDLPFISADHIIAEVKFGLKSYFESGLLTEALIPTYIDNAMRKLGTLALKSDEYIIRITNYKGELPADFHKLIIAYTYNTYYEYTTGTPSITGWYVRNDDCVSCTNCPNEGGVYEQLQIQGSYEKISLKEPTILKVVYSDSYCIEECENIRADHPDSLKIFGKQVAATFDEGAVLIRYYKRLVDSNGTPMIPEVFEVEDYIKAWVTYGLIEQLYNGTSVETYNQVRDKFQFYYQMAYRKLEAALNVLKMQDAGQFKKGLARQKRRNLKFDIK